jgi:proline iminopeptidase
MRERPTVLMLHGGPGSDHATFRPFMSFLSEHAQVIYFDQRGHGRSDASKPEDWTLSQWADDAAGLLDALDVRKPLVLGASFGGFVAQAFATAYPERMSKLALVSSAPRTDADLAAQTFARLGGPEVGEIARQFLSGNADMVGEYMQRCVPFYNVRGFDLTELARSISSPDIAHRFFSPEGEWHTFDFRPSLARIQCPTLVLHGELDPILPVELARELHAGIRPGLARLHIVENAGHGWGDKPDEWRALLQNFLFES